VLELTHDWVGGCGCVGCIGCVVLELMHNWVVVGGSCSALLPCWPAHLPPCLPGLLQGTESDPEFKGYHNGNSDPRGFGHIGLAVPDVEAACARFEE
jgi:hypothetical protein